MRVCDVRPACDLVNAPRILKSNSIPLLNCLGAELRARKVSLTNISKLSILKDHKVVSESKICQLLDDSMIKVFDDVNVCLQRRRKHQYRKS